MMMTMTRDGGDGDADDGNDGVVGPGEGRW